MKHSAEDLEDFRDSELINSNLIQRVAPSTYQLHPLIRKFFQSQLSSASNADEMKEQFCQKMSDISGEIPLGLTLADKRSDFFSLSVPHIISAATEWKDWLSQSGLVQACTGLGHFYQAQGLFEEAYPWRKQSLDHGSTEADENSIDHLSSLMYLGSLKFSQG
ncbi:MAG: tetratricopeptide repeat protein, partial [Cyanobacteria bacterium J06555_13]